MKKTTYVNKTLVFLLFLFSVQLFAQNLVPFSPRYDEAIKGDILLIGNSNVGLHVSDPYNGTNTNDRADAAVYVDIDGDPSTFNSSSADLDVPNDVSCYKIVYAGLYWSAVVNGADPISDIKFKIPGGSYTDITGTQVYFQNAPNNNNSNTYVYYHDVTNMLTALPDPEGTYSVANISSMVGPKPNSEGLSAGWSLFVIYEDPLLPSKYITSFDGFTKITSTISETFPVSGFKTIPTGPVRAKFAFSTIEGDRRYTGDYLRLNGNTIDATNNAGTVIRPGDNFFNSTVSYIDPITNTPELFTTRNPDGSNTLGFDAGIINIPNAGNTIIANGATSATISLGSTLDIYYYYFSAFAIEIIAPNIVLTKIVEDEFGTNIGGQVVDLGDELYYTIGFQNTGNDDATNLTIRDILPTNVVFNYPTDLGVLPSGVTVQSYDATTRELIFSIDPLVVEENDPVTEIRFMVTVVSTCSLLSDACSNNIDNQAYATYQGTINPTFTISDDPSFSSNTGCLLTPGATNFLADLNDCVFEEEVVLCGANVVLTAGNGYDAYSWSTSPSGTPVIGTTQSITVTNPGTYYVHNTAVAPCQSIDQVFDVITFGANVTNPIIPFADQVVTCPNDGKQLPNIFLCGANDSKLIQTGITDTTSIIWEKLDETSCTAVINQDCANEDSGCTWNQVTTGPDFMADTAGQYRLTLNYTGGCFNQFYFNIYTNLLIPTATSKDIICTTPGEITVGGVPSGYEYSIDGVNYQPSNVFTITTPNLYSVYVRQIGVSPNPCIFSVPDVQVRQRDFTVSTIITQPICHGEKGSVVLAANDVRPQYFFSIYQGGTLVNSVGPIMNNDYTFDNLNSGIYTVNVSTEDGCIYTDDIEIIEPPLLEATAALTVPLTCTDGEITVYPVGGTPPYSYFVNSTTVFQGTPIIPVSTAGVYNITVVDFNNCSANTSITVDAIPAPVYTVDHTDILCYNSNTGEIQFNVTNANGYTIEYSIDNGATYVPNATFSNLDTGTYSTSIKYSLNSIECFSTVQDIIITQPDTALTASAGISELAGCGPSGEGKLRITNPQGGTPPYEYSFDNQATWVTTNEAYALPGTYTLYIRDANLCVYAMQDIVLDQEPVAPTIDVSDPNFNCDGTADATVTVTNTGSSSFTYTYLLDGVENTNTVDPKTFLNVSDGSHIISVEYDLSIVSTYSNLLNESFGSGNPTTTSGIANAYCFNDQRVSSPYLCGTRSVEDNQYSVTSFFWRSDDPLANNTGAWYHFNDHTTNGSDPEGRYLLVNIGSAAGPYGILYSKPIKDVIPNQDIQVDLYLANLLRQGINAANPDFRIQLVDVFGNVIAEQFTGIIPNNEQWNLNSVTLNPGNNTELTFVIRSGSIEYGGNDAVIDDISVYQLPKSCVTKVDFPFIVGSEKAFTSDIIGFKDTSCNGDADGEITIAAQNFDTSKGFQYTIDGTNWNTQMTSPHTITGLAAGSYNIQVRYEDVVNTCSFTFNQDITAPTLLEVTASGTPVTCLDGSTVRAIGTGGTPTYSYELLDASLNLVANFPSSGVLTNVAAGDYTVRVTDVNSCTATNTISLLVPTTPTASISSTSDYCYDVTNGATLEVSALGGQPPYEYNINGSAFQSSSIFTNLSPGTYDIIVRDSYGCSFNLPTETIATEVTLSTVLTKDLDCTITPDAIITGTFSGGTAPYTYAVSVNNGVYSDLGVPGNPFTYSTPNDGTYQFQITDANGCTTESGVQTINVISLPEISSISSTPNICSGDTNGTIQVTINNSVGTPPFTINVRNDDNGSNFGSQTSGLPSGNYTVTLTDSKSCTDTATVTIAAPDPLDVKYHPEPITCDPLGGTVSGSIIIEGVTGGTAPYNYFVTGTNGYSDSELNATGAISTTFNVVEFGLYQINVVDANGCSFLIQDVLVASPPDHFDVTVTSPPADCSTGGSALVAVGTALVGAGPFHFAIYTGPGMTYTAPTAFPWQDEDALGSKQTTFYDLLPGATYTYIVFDESTGCYFYETTITPIPTNSTLIANALTSNNITCVGSADGNVSFDVTSVYPVPTNVTYEIRDSQTFAIVGIPGSGIVPANGTLNISNFGTLDFGNYFVSITEAAGATNAGCSVVSVPFNITESAFDLNITATVDKNANCNPNSGVISAIARDGTAPYLYQITTSAVAPLATDPSWTTTNVFNMDTNSYYVHAKDAYGCIKSTPVLVLPSDPEPVITATLNNQCTVTEGNFEIDVTLTTSGISPYSFSIDGGAFQTRTAPFSISNLTSGTHTVEVQDVNGCGNLVSIDIQKPIGLTSEVTTLPSCDDDDGVITVTGSGGSGIGNYTYAIVSPASATGNVTGAASGVFSLMPAGTYTIRITDSNTLCTKDVSVILEAPTPVTFTTTPTSVSCNGGNDGIITVNLPVSNDNPIYTYSLDGGVTTQTSNVFTGLIAATYNITVTSGRNCTLTQQETVDEPNIIVVSAPLVVDYACATGTNTSNYASITVNSVTGGSGTYTNYEFVRGGLIVQSGSNNVYIESDFLGGSYTINVYDDNGCLGNTTAIIEPFISLETLNVTVDNAITCTNDEDITVSVTTSGGIPTNLEYLLEDADAVMPSQTNTTGVFTALPIGNYIVTVTNLTTACSLQTVHYVNNPNTFDLTIDSVIDVTCYNANDGSINVTFIDRVPTPTDESGPFNYSIVDNLGNTVTSGSTPNAGPITISSLLGGTYTINATLINSPFCGISKNFTITMPTAELTVVATETSSVTCDDDKGTITAVASGGWGAIEYELTGAATVAYSSNGTFTNLSAGAYTVNARDSRGCIASDGVTLIIPNPINATVAANTTLLSCFGDTNASITASVVTGGQGSNYSFTLNMLSPTVTSSGPQLSPVFTGLGAGTYNVVITDGYNCEFTSPDIIITQPAQIQAALVKATSQTCSTDSTLELSATGGTGTYEYSTTESFATIVGSFTSSVSFTVTDGTFAYYVRDANGCTANVSNEITIDPLPILEVTIDATNAKINCAGDTTGVIVATAQGGLGSYIYTLQDGTGTNISPLNQNTTGNFTDLPVGSYQVRVDSGDCLTTSTIISITEPSLPLDVSFTVTDVTCTGANNGLLEIVATGGTGIIKYAISPQMNQFFESPIFENLAPGNYQAIAQDELGCYVLFDFVVNDPIPVSLTIVPNSIIPELCDGDLNGAFSIDISGGDMPYSVALDDINGVYTTGTLTQTQFDFTNLSGGDHVVYVSDALGCESEWNITFPESVLINPIADIEYGCTNNLSTNTVTVSVDDSITDLSSLSYSLDGGEYQASNIFINVPPGLNHYIDVSHTNGCVKRTELFDISHYDPLALVLEDGELNQIIAVASGGSGDYEYTLNGESYGSENTFIIYESGDYTVTVTDRFGCVATATKYYEYIDVCITNYFTPNDDGNQDEWGPGCTNQYKDLKFDIFDRYGRKIATLRVGDKWDGRYNGAELPSGDYWYVVKLNDTKDDREFVGHFTLYR
tara:strand:- start:14027 stop:24442 length:10416 start_codon:yes stop_codon:yes gene_type:complete